MAEAEVFVFKIRIGHGGGCGKIEFFYWRAPEGSRPIRSAPVVPAFSRESGGRESNERADEEGGGWRVLCGPGGVLDAVPLGEAEWLLPGGRAGPGRRFGARQQQVTAKNDPA